jgi:arginine N-succinyltransferase
VLGEPDTSALLAYEIHLEEGFEPDRYVDIFDAGPVLTAQVDRTTSAAAGESRTVREAASGGPGASYMVASQRAGEFRCVLATLPERAQRHAGHADAPLEKAACAALGVHEGDAVRCAPLWRETPQTEDQTTGEAR